MPNKVIQKIAKTNQAILKQNNYFNPTFPDEFKKLITEVFKVMAVYRTKPYPSKSKVLNKDKKIFLNKVSEKWLKQIKKAIENFVLIDDICNSSEGQYFNKEELAYYISDIYIDEFQDDYIAGSLTSDEVLDKTKQYIIDQLTQLKQYAVQDPSIVSTLIGFMFLECGILEVEDNFDKNNNLISRK